ncbi:MFS transporter [Novosphingobium kaempferiae]|uniref:MFS transporter n=1 Tax=Novosphingobium kaempferiae TaxID=2896849 RepID=UPI001E5D4A16|nr:MFS transporter [Novosphingobium kaempferiae]
MKVEATGTIRPASVSRRSALRPNWTLALLSILYILSLVDRMILALLIAPVKAELGISDVQIGLLVGTAFAIIYGLLGIPLARLADSGNRRRIILAGLVIWSASTVGSAFATSYTMLVLLRLGLAIGEAALLPATYSMIGDLFPPQKRAPAASIFAALGAAGAGGAFILGAIIIDSVDMLRSMAAIPAAIADWRIVLILVGAPGLLLAVVLCLTVSEPPRGGHGAEARSEASLVTLVTHAKQHARMYAGLMSCAFTGTVSYAFVTWLPEMLRRDFGWSAAQAGSTLGWILVVSVLFGSLAGPRAAERLMRAGHHDGFILVSAAMVLLGMLTAILAAMQSSASALLTIYFFTSMFLSGCSNTCITSIQIVSPARMRGTVVATYMLLISMAGLGIGPPLTAWLSTNFFYGSIGPALALVAIAVGAPTLATQIWSRKGYKVRITAIAERNGEG